VGDVHFVSQSRDYFISLIGQSCGHASFYRRERRKHEKTSFFDCRLPVFGNAHRFNAAGWADNDRLPATKQNL
jgi:hypothetical protein